MVLKTKEVGVFKESSKSGSVGVIDIGDRGKHYIIDLDEIDALTVLDSKHNQDFRDIMNDGQDGKRFQNKELGLVNNETGEIDIELVNLIKEAASNYGNSDAPIFLEGFGDGYIEIGVQGDWSTDILRFESTEFDFCDFLPTLVDLKNSKSQFAVFDYGDDANTNKSFFHGSDADVDSAAVKDILGGSRLDIDEAVELIQYALSSEGQADENISIEFNGDGFIVSIDASRDTTDTIYLKGAGLAEAVNTTLFNGAPIVDLKNKNSQIAVFDFDEASSFFHGSDSSVDSAAVQSILGGSRLDAGEAKELVDYALSEAGQADPGISYLGGDGDSAIIKIETSGDSADILILDGIA